MCLSVCVCGVAEYPVTTINSRGHSTSLGLCPTKLPVKWDIQLGQLDVPASVILKVYLAPLVAALFVLLVLSGNVFVSRVKPSALRAETCA